MSKGSVRIILRVPDDMMNAIAAAIASNNDARADAPYDTSSWVRQAIQERLDKQARGRKPKGKKADAK